jgi:hypothetical protein
LTQKSLPLYFEGTLGFNMLCCGRTLPEEIINSRSNSDEASPQVTRCVKQSNYMIPIFTHVQGFSNVHNTQVAVQASCGAKVGNPQYSRWSAYHRMPFSLA